MPTIDVPQRRVAPTTAITDTRRQIPTGIFSAEFAAGQGLARAIVQAGRVLGSAAAAQARQETEAREKTLRVQVEEETTKAKLGYETAFRTFQEELLTDTDYAGYTKKFNNWHDTTTAELSKLINHPEAQARAKNQFDLNRAIRGRTVDTNAQNSLVRQTRASLADKMEAFVSEELQADTPATLKKAVAERKAYFQTLIDTGVVNAVEAAGLERDYQTAKGKRVLQNTVTGIAVEEGWDEAIGWLNDPENVKRLFDEFGITLADVDSILEDVKTQANLSRADGKAELENQRTTDRQAVLDKFIAEDFGDTTDFINNTALSPQEKLSWIEKAEARADALIKDKPDPFKRTHNPTYWALRRKIETEPGSVTEDDLARVVGKGGEPKFVLPTPEQQQKNALTGELGQVKNSSEISITVTDSRLNGGKPTNIPTLVKGQINIDRLTETLEPTEEQQEVAIKRAAERVAAGATLPSYASIDEAVNAAVARSDAKEIGGGISISDYETLLGMVKDQAKTAKPTNPLNTNSSRRTQSSFGRLREAEISLIKTPRREEDIPEIRKINNKWLRIANEYDAYLLSEEGMKATDEQREKKKQALEREPIEEITLSWLERKLLVKETTPFLRRFGTTEEALLLQKKISGLKGDPIFERFTEAEQNRAIELIESGLTVEQAVSEIEEPIPLVTTQAERDALPSGTRYRDKNGNIGIRK